MSDSGRNRGQRAGFTGIITAVLWAAATVGLTGTALGGELGEQIRARGFTVIAEEAGITGLRSSYHGRPIDDLDAGEMPQFSEKRIRFGGSTQPSPGGRTGRHFDEGALAYRYDAANGQLTLLVAAGCDPDRWYRDGSFSSSPHGQGDLFVDVRTASGQVLHFALLQPLDGGRSVGHRGLFDRAGAFRYGSEEVDAADQGASDAPATRPGSLVRLTSEDQIAKSGGKRGFARHENSPRGLDERVLAQGGRWIASPRFERYELSAHQPLVNGPAPWYVTEWTFPVAALGDGDDAATEIALHIATTCGNDQIGASIVLAEQAEAGKPARPSIH